MKLSRRQILLAIGLLPFLEIGETSGFARRNESETNKIMNEKNDIYDCIVVGAGSAGLSAALTLGRARRRVFICDKGNPRNAPAAHSHGFFTRDGTNPLELLEIGREQLKPYKTIEFQSVGVKEIKRSSTLR